MPLDDCSPATNEPVKGHNSVTNRIQREDKMAQGWLASQAQATRNAAGTLQTIERILQTIHAPHDGSDNYGPGQPGTPGKDDNVRKFLKPDYMVVVFTRLGIGVRAVGRAWPCACLWVEQLREHEDSCEYKTDLCEVSCDLILSCSLTL